MRDSIEQLFAAFKPPRQITVRATSSAPPERVWELLADVTAWPRWAPHIAAVDVRERRVEDRPRAAATAPSAHVRPGDRLRVHGPPPVAVAATVTLVDPGRRWDFVVDLPGPWRLHSRHEVCVRGGVTYVAVAMRVDGFAGRAVTPLLTAYRPLAGWAVRRLARLAETPAA